MRKSLSVVAIALLAATVSGCGGSSSEPALPPPPPQIFTVIHKDLDGTVTTDRALTYYPTDGGCVYYHNPDDQARGINMFRLFCGGTTHVRPEER